MLIFRSFKAQDLNLNAGAIIKGRILSLKYKFSEKNQLDLPNSVEIKSCVKHILNINKFKMHHHIYNFINFKILSLPY